MGIVTTQTFTLNFKQHNFFFCFGRVRAAFWGGKKNRTKQKKRCIIKVAIIKYLGH